MMLKCECEHKAHTENKLTPNGNPSHKYGTRFYDRFMKMIITPFGKFNVCLDCANDCLQEYNSVSK